MPTKPSALRTMADSTNPTDIPKGPPGIVVDMVAGYIDGAYNNFAAMRRRFPHLPVVPISVNGDGLPKIKAGATVALDIETGDFTPATGAALFAQLLGRGVIPVIYCNRSTWPAVRRELARRHVARRDRLRWLAGWTGERYMIRGRYVLATQYADPPKSGGHYDLSAVKPYWPGLDPVPGRPITAAHRKMARRLTAAWSRRQHPLSSAADVKMLNDLRQAIDRVLKL